MPILQQVLKNYENILMPYEYELTFKNSLGQIGVIKIEFKKENLKHLLGIHKIPPYDNNQRYSGNLVFNQIKNNTLKYSNLLTQSKSEEVTVRIIHFLELSYLFEENILKNIYLFDRTNFTGRTNIKAKYILYLDKVCFSLNFGIALDMIKNYYYPETWFINERDKDKYIKNQEKLDIISIKKIKK